MNEKTNTSEPVSGRALCCWVSPWTEDDPPRRLVVGIDSITFRLIVWLEYGWQKYVEPVGMVACSRESSEISEIVIQWMKAKGLNHERCSSDIHEALLRGMPRLLVSDISYYRS